MKEQSVWVHCPICRGKTRIKVYRDSVLLNFPLYCPVCRRETRVSIVQLRMSLIEEETVSTTP